MKCIDTRKLQKLLLTDFLKVSEIGSYVTIMRISRRINTTHNVDMMAGGGSIAAMITILRNNKLLLRKKSMFKKERSFLNTKEKFYTNAETKIFTKKATPHQLKEVRNKLNKHRKAEYRKLFLAFGIVTICMAVFVSWSAYSESDILDYPYQNKEQRAGLNPLDTYQFFIEDGDRWLKEEHWHNAIFQYQEALKLFPNEYDANYRLTLAYSYQCAAQKQHCEDGIKLMHQLSIQNPKKKELMELRTFYLKIFPGTK